MRILMIQPNYHSGGAEIAGNWPPSWVPYVGGALKQAGFDNVRFVDAMTNYIDDATLAEIIEKNQPDVVLATAITPMIYQSQETLRIVKEVCPNAIAVMGGIHPTYMYREVLHEAPWVDYIIRGEGEEITVNLMRAIADGTHRRDRRQILGLAFLESGEVVATPPHPPIKNLDTLSPDWSLLDWDRYIYTPLNVRVAVPNYARGCPFRCRFCSQWKFWRKYRSRSPKLFVDEIETLVKEYGIGFFILADEEPTINKPRFMALCRELIDRKLDVHWGINTRVTDVLRDEKELPLYRQAGLVHVSLGTEAAAQLNLNVFRKETTIEDNKRAVKLLQDNGMVAEAQFIMGLENELPETIEETYRMALDWNPDMVNWNMFTPWPFSDLFEDLGDRVEIRDYSQYNFVTPIMKPDNMEREDVLKGVLRNYARFYMRKALTYWFERDPFKRRYLLGCLKAFATTTLNKRFYNLKRVKYEGLQAKVELGFDESRILTAEEIARRKREWAADTDFSGTGTCDPARVPTAWGANEAALEPAPANGASSGADGSGTAAIAACGAPNDLPDFVESGEDVLEVFLVEDDEPTRVALREALRSRDGLDVYSEATNGVTGLVLLESVAGGHVALVDATLPDLAIAEFVQRFRAGRADSDNPNLKVLVAVASDRPEDWREALAAEADGYCLKGAGTDELEVALRLVHRGDRYLAPELARALLDGSPEDVGDAAARADRAVLAGLAAGDDFDTLGPRLHRTARELNAAIDRAIADRVGCDLAAIER